MKVIPMNPRDRERHIKLWATMYFIHEGLSRKEAIKKAKQDMKDYEAGRGEFQRI